MPDEVRWSKHVGNYSTGAGPIRLKASWHEDLAPELTDQALDLTVSPHPVIDDDVLYSAPPTGVRDYTTWQKAPAWFETVHGMRFPNSSDDGTRPGPYALTGGYGPTGEPYPCEFFGDPPGWHCPPNNEAPGITRLQGRTLYDPFPYPDYPLYFWMDLSEAQAMMVFWGGDPGGEVRLPQYTTAPVVPDGDTTPLSAYAHNYDPPWSDELEDRRADADLKIWLSLDGGETWEAPMIEGRDGDGTDITEGTYTGLPWSDPNYTASTRNATARVSQVSPGLTTTHREPYPVGFAQLKEEFYTDDVLAKFTLETGNADDIVYLSYFGVKVI